MMDEFDEKRGMVKMLLDMLKGSAGDEVMQGLKPPESQEGDGMKIEKVSVMPHDEKEGDMSPEGESMADEVLPKGAIAEEMKRAPEMAAEDDAENHADGEDEEMEDSPSHAFASFMSRKKGKK